MNECITRQSSRFQEDSDLGGVPKKQKLLQYTHTVNFRCKEHILGDRIRGEYVGSTSDGGYFAVNNTIKDQVEVFQFNKEVPSMSIMMFSFRGKIRLFDYGNSIFLCDADVFTTTGIHVKRLTEKVV